MPNVVNLTADTLRRIIEEERYKLMLEAKRAKSNGNGNGKGNGRMPKPTFKQDAAVSKHHKRVTEKAKTPAVKKVEAANGKHRKAMSLQETEVEAADMAETLANKVKHLKEMKSMEQKLRSQLRLVLEKKSGIEQDLADLL